MAWKLPVKLSLVVLLTLATLLELFNYLYASQRALNREFVKVFSYLVFSVALLNFVMLGFAFWYVVFHKKEDDYYLEHFLMQRTGGVGLSQNASIGRSQNFSRSDRSKAAELKEMETNRYNGAAIEMTVLNKGMISVQNFEISSKNLGDSGMMVTPRSVSVEPSFRDLEPFENTDVKLKDASNPLAPSAFM